MREDGGEREISMSRDDSVKSVMVQVRTAKEKVGGRVT